MNNKETIHKWAVYAKNTFSPNKIKFVSKDPKCYTTKLTNAYLYDTRQQARKDIAYPDEKVAKVHIQYTMVK